jgi:hypothetical protein
MAKINGSPVRARAETTNEPANMMKLLLEIRNGPSNLETPMKAGYPIIGGQPIFELGGDNSPLEIRYGRMRGSSGIALDQYSFVILKTALTAQMHSADLLRAPMPPDPPGRISHRAGMQGASAGTCLALNRQLQGHAGGSLCLLRCRGAIVALNADELGKDVVRT